MRCPGITLLPASRTSKVQAHPAPTKLKVEPIFLRGSQAKQGPERECTRLKQAGNRRSQNLEIWGSLSKVRETAALALGGPLEMTQVTPPWFSRKGNGGPEQGRDLSNS